MFHTARLYRGGFLTRIWVGQGQVDIILEELRAAETTSRVCMSATKPPTNVCVFRSIDPESMTAIYCSKPVSDMSRHFLCPFHDRFHDLSHHMYKALEGKVKDLSFNEWKRAWALRLAHGLSFFG